MALNREQNLLTPILVTGMGRSGSTLAMQLLGTDESCVMDRVYPLESRYLSLIAQTAAQWDGRTFAEYGPPSTANQNILGSNPIVLRNNVESNILLNIPKSSDMFKAMWRQFSIAARSGAPSSNFYAEKVVEWIPSFIAPLIDCYTLFLFRDPRDLYLSTNSFNSKRGYLAFGRNEGDSDLDHAMTLAYRFLHRYENYKALKRSGALVGLIRYEDLASNPVSALKDLMDTTGINIRELEQNQSFDQHKTAASLEQSIERWRKEPLPEGVLEVIGQTLGTILDELGYSQSIPHCSDKPKLSLHALTGADNETLAGELFAHIEASHKEPISIDLDATGVDIQEVSELWVCLSGGFGGRCTMNWGNDSSSQDYDIGPHVATLRFKLKQPPNSTRLRISIAHTGAISPSAVASTVKIHRLELITPSVSRQLSAKTSRVNGFLNQFIRINR